VVSSIAGRTARELLRAFVSAHPAVDLQITRCSPREHVSAVRALKIPRKRFYDLKMAAAPC